MNRLFIISSLFLIALTAACQHEQKKTEAKESSTSSKLLQDDTVSTVQHIIVGAARFEEYLHHLDSKRVALVVNQTSVIGNTHLVDTLLSKGIQVKKVFAPEHGFRGNADAGAVVDDGVDEQTGIPIISLYGKNKKPTAQHLKNIDVVVFDIQDVGVRFYTYISTMHYVMEACAIFDKPFIVLDRPNPNGDYIAGPVLQSGFNSFVGMHAIPIVHGLTVGELARMINGEKWLAEGKTCELTVIPNKFYDHSSNYSLPIAPSPNLPNDASIRLYPSLCLFEPTTMSIGRGTDFPFQVIGYPDSTFGAFSFTPVSMPGKSTHPKHEGLKCFGKDLQELAEEHRFTIDYVSEYYQLCQEKDIPFFNNQRFFNLLSGTDALAKQLQAGEDSKAIEASWKEELDAYKTLRHQYLLYPDFE